MFCPHCGGQVSEEELFCTECGGRLKDIGTTSLMPSEPTAEEDLSLEEEPEPAEEPRILIGAPAKPAPIGSGPTPGPQPDLSQMTDRPAQEVLVCEPPQKKSGNNTLKWIIVVAVLVITLCCCCALAGLVFLSYA